MTYTFSKIIKPTAKAQYGNYVTNECYIVNDIESEIGQYFITPLKDYFNFYSTELEMYSISHLPINNKKVFINEMGNNTVGYYQSNVIKEKGITNYGLIVLGDNTYNCSQVPIGHGVACKNLIIMNNDEQLFITYTENRKKNDANNVAVVQGTMEMQGNNLLLLFASIYYLEEMLFMGNTI
jgi:hypothetical protein